MNKNLLVETRPAQFQIIDEAGGAGRPVKIRCETMSIADQPNSNHRVYPYDIWRREIDRLQERIKTGALLGSVDHPAEGRTRITGAGAAAIKWTDISMNGKNTSGVGVIMGTAAGSDLAALLRSNARVDVSSRGFGSTVERTVNGQRVQVVEQDFQLESFDAVLGGSVSSARMELAESRQHRTLTEEEIRQRQLTGLFTEWAWPAVGSSDGILHSANYDVQDQRHSVSKPSMEKHPDFRDRLSAAVLAQKKLKVHVIAPASEDTWSAYDVEGQRMILVSFTQSADERITVTNITDNVDVRRVAEAYEIRRQQLMEAEFNDPELRLRQQVLAGIR